MGIRNNGWCQLTDEIAIDAEGYLHTIRIPYLTLMDVIDDSQPYEEPAPDFEWFPRIKLKAPNDKIEPVRVEIFYPKAFEPPPPSAD